MTYHIILIFIPDINIEIRRFSKKNEKITTEFICLFILKIILFYMTIFFKYQTHKKVQYTNVLISTMTEVLRDKQRQLSHLVQKVAEDFFFLVLLSYKFSLLD